jgi:alpha/beta superfamily hydrolase
LYTFKSSKGYSYGSVSSLAACCDVENVIGLVSISYPIDGIYCFYYLVLWALTAFHHSKLIASISHLPQFIPKLFITGSNDNFSSSSNWKEFVGRVNGDIEVVLIENIDHFWFGNEDTLTNHITTWVKNKQLLK